MRNFELGAMSHACVGMLAEVYGMPTQAWDMAPDNCFETLTKHN